MNLDIEETIKKLLDNIGMNKYSCIIELIKLCEDMNRHSDQKALVKLPHYNLALEVITNLSIGLTE